MSDLISKIFAVESSAKKSRHGNVIAIFCAIVAVVTCCYSSIMANTKVENRQVSIKRVIEKTMTEQP